jgi:threonine/homoserine/homoserine lactone efflux protein
VQWSSYLSFLGFAIVLVLIPGPDFAVVTKNALLGGRRRGLACALGVACSNATQGALAAAGLGVIVVRVEPLFQTIKWAGIAYLLYLAVGALRSAVRGQYSEALSSGRGTGWWQGYLSNITNPKVLVFYLAVLPQFLGPHSPVYALLVFAVSHAVLSLTYLSTLVTCLHRARNLFRRRRVRRALDAATGAALLSFGARLALDR